MKTLISLLIPCLLLPGLFAQDKPADSEGEVTLKEIFNHRQFWPASISLSADQEIELQKTDGSGTEKLAAKKGDEFRLAGVKKQGVKVRNDKGMAYIPLEGTSLVSDIESKLDGKKLARILPEPEPVPGAVAVGGGKLEASLAKVLPAELVDAEGKPFALDNLGGKFIGVYFSAKWCPPCRGFTPSLVKFRNKHAAEFEVIFVSSDKTEAAMKGYMKEYNMQFAAAKYRSEGHKKLSGQFAARGIPHLVILAPDGRVISTNGRGDVGRGDAALDGWKAKAGR